MFKIKTRKIGVFLGRDAIAVCEKTGDSQGKPMFWQKSYSLNGESSGGEKLLGNVDIIKKMAADVSEKIANAYAEVNVALADPYMFSRVLMMEHDPGAQENLSEFLRWRFKSDYFIDAEKMDLTYQSLGKAEGKYAVLAQVCERNLLELLTGSFAAYGIPLNIIDSSYNYVHNFLIPKINKRATGILLHSDGFWTYSLLDEELRPVNIKSGWIKSEGENSEDHLDEVFSKIGRSFYFDVEKRFGNKEEVPEIYLVGKDDEPYEEVCNNYFMGGCKQHNDFLAKRELRDYMKGHGVLAIERLVAECQR